MRAHEPDPRRARLGAILADFAAGHLPPPGWYREFGLGDDHWSDHWAAVSVHELGTIGDGESDTFRSAIEWADARAAQRELRQDILQVARTIEACRKDGRPLREQLVHEDSPAIPISRDTIYDQRTARQVGEQTWATLRILDLAAAGRCRPAG